jgi:hypothetical protein
VKLLSHRVIYYLWALLQTALPSSLGHIPKYSQFPHSPVRKAVTKIKLLDVVRITERGIFFYVAGDSARSFEMMIIL